MSDNGRDAFRLAASQFLDTYIGVYSQGMWDEVERRYRKLDRILRKLECSGKISTCDPAGLTAEDIKAFIIFRRSQGLKDTSISHDVSALANLCRFVNGNLCVSQARTRYPLLFARRRKRLLPVLERPQFDAIVTMADSVTEKSDFYRIRDYAIVMLALCAGLRTQELQYSKLALISEDRTTIHLDHVKGMDTYGDERTVPIRPECRQILELWISQRIRHYPKSPYLFPSRYEGVMATNTFSHCRRRVGAEVGFDFDFRILRRTYAQYIVDEELLSMDEVAIILGHSSVKTTESNYARPREDRVVAKLVEAWEENRGSGLLLGDDLHDV